MLECINKDNICYNEECERNNKNGLCKIPPLECKYRDTEQPIPINYEEEYEKLKTVIEDKDFTIKNLENGIKQLKEKECENEDLKLENEKLRKTNASYYDEYKDHLEMLKGENNKLTYQYGEAQYFIEKLEKEKEENKEKLENYRLLKKNDKSINRRVIGGRKMELKYKVWDKEEKKMLTISFENEENRHNVGKAILHYSTSSGIYATLSGYRDEDGNPYQIDAEKLPYTGVKDINKKESYLGDILKKQINEWLSEKQREVCEKAKSFYIVKKESNSNNMYLEYNFNIRGYWEINKFPISKIEELEKVGNIFENPDMIKKK